jgi:hypothetical protein
MLRDEIKKKLRKWFKIKQMPTKKNKYQIIDKFWLICKEMVRLK